MFHNLPNDGLSRDHTGKISESFLKDDGKIGGFKKLGIMT
jgi:hypothetical protein